MSCWYDYEVHNIYFYVEFHTSFLLQLWATDVCVTAWPVPMYDVVVVFADVWMRWVAPSSVRMSRKFFLSS